MCIRDRLILGGTGKNFAAGMSGGIAYVLDEKHDLYLRVNKELVNIETVTEKHDINEIKTLLTEHEEATGSPLAKRILENLSLIHISKLLRHLRTQLTKQQNLTY